MSSINEERLLNAIRSGGVARDRALKTLFLRRDLRQAVERVQSEGGGGALDYFPLFRQCLVLFDRYVRWFPSVDVRVMSAFERMAKYKWGQWLRERADYREAAIGYVADDRQILPRLEGMIAKSGGQRAEAEDFYQQGILKLYEQLQEGKYRGGAISGYFIQVCFNLWRNDRRRSQPILPGDDSVLVTVDESNPYEALELKDFREQWYGAFLKLGKRCRMILTLKYFRRQSFSMEEIAEKTGYKNAQNASNALLRCKKKWKVFIEA